MDGLDQHGGWIGSLDSLVQFIDFDSSQPVVMTLSEGRIAVKVPDFLGDPNKGLGGSYELGVNMST